MRVDFWLRRACGVLAVAAALVAVSAPAIAEDWPSVDEAKAIAEEGFIYGLPIVMNYAVMYEYAVNKNSGQFKAPFNEIKNEATCLHLQGYRGHHPEQRHALLAAWLDLRAEPIVLSVPAVESDRYYSVQLFDGNTYNYGYIGSRATGNEPGTTWW